MSDIDDFLSAFGPGTFEVASVATKGASTGVEFTPSTEPVEVVAPSVSAPDVTEDIPVVEAPTVISIAPELNEVSEANETPEAKLARLQQELALLRLEKQIAEEKLERELRLQKEAASNATLTVKQDWIALANELAMLKGDVIGEKTPLENGVLDKEASEGLCIDFVNKLRIGVLKDLENDTDEVVIVKAKAYEIYYRATLHTLESRKVAIKIKRRDEFEATKKREKEKSNEIRREKEVKKEASRRRTPDEILLESLMALGTPKEVALKQIEAMKNAAKGLK